MLNGPDSIFQLLPAYIRQRDAQSGAPLQQLLAIIGAQAQLIDRDLLREAQAAGDVLAAHRVLADAFKTDVRPLITALRMEQGLSANPIKAHRQSGYQAKVAQERGVQSGGGGYPVKEKVHNV